MNRKRGFIYSAYRLYADGFRQMTVGRTLWAVIIIKLIIIFGVLKLFFFPNFLSTHAEKGEEHQYVGRQLIERAQTSGNNKEMKQQSTNQIK